MNTIRNSKISATKKCSRELFFINPLFLKGFRAVVGDECFWDADVAFWGLVLLKNGDEETGESGAGTIEGVAEGVVPLGVLVAELHAAGLVVAKAGAAGNLEEFVLTG